METIGVNISSVLPNNHSPQLLCSSQRRTGPCSGRCSTVGRLSCGKVFLVKPLRATSRPPRIEHKLGLFPAWLWLETGTAGSMCAQTETAAWLHLFYKSLMSTSTLDQRKLQKTLSTPQHTWPTFSTPAPRGQHKWQKAAARGEQNLTLGAKRCSKVSSRCHTCI